MFLGPGGAQYNMPQMYWKDIGVSVDTVFAHTYIYNMPYRRKIFPLGQVYGSPPGHQIFRFRQLSRAYDAHGVSWWDWQQASSSGWTAVSRPAGSLPGYTADKVMASIGKGAVGDLVVWAQEHLISAGYRLGVDGGFGPTTQSVVQDFQSAHGLTATGSSARRHGECCFATARRRSVSWPAPPSGTAGSPGAPANAGAELWWSRSRSPPHGPRSATSSPAPAARGAPTTPDAQAARPTGG